MDTEEINLGLSAVASTSWRWKPKMLAVPNDGSLLPPPLRLTDLRHPSYPEEFDWPHDLGLRVPDLRDRETLDAVKSLVSDRLKARGLCGLVRVKHHPNLNPELEINWEVWGDGRLVVWGKTEAHALVAALWRDF